MAGLMWTKAVLCCSHYTEAVGCNPRLVGRINALFLCCGMYYYTYTQCVLCIYIFWTNYKGKMQRWFKTSWKVTNLPHFQQTKNFSPSLMQKVFDMPSLIHKKQKVRRLLSISHKDMQDPRQNIVNNCHSSFKTIFFSFYWTIL